MLKKISNKSEIDNLKKQNEVVYFKSRFNFLKCTCGIRPGLLTGLLSTTGSGKSSLTKAIISDIALDSEVLVWLSEEPQDQYEVKMLENNFDRNNVFFIHEETLPKLRSSEEYWFLFEEEVLKTNVKIVVIDNITTSILYDTTHQGQNSIVQKMREFSQKYNIAIFYIAHTAKNVQKNRLLEGDDIRGTNQLYQQTSYFYIMQVFTIDGRRYPFIQIDKHRHHDILNKYFVLNYDYTKKNYVSDKSIRFSDINNMFRKRDYLGKKNVQKTDSPNATR